MSGIEDIRSKEPWVLAPRMEMTMIKVWFCLELNGTLVQNQSTKLGVHENMLGMKTNMIFIKWICMWNSRCTEDLLVYQPKREYYVALFLHKIACVC